MVTVRYLAVLDTMYDWRGLTSGAGYVKQAPRFFSINPDNFSGGRLYRLIGGERIQLDVTNVCPEVAISANHHGTPSLPWLTENLTRWGKLLNLGHNQGVKATILVCGNIAQQTFDQLKELPDGRIIYLPHPAARNWTTLAMGRAAEFITGYGVNLRMRITKGRLIVRRLYR